jgi:Putative stress-induced transcription regulator
VIVTASLIGMTLPSWASHLENKVAPPSLLVVQAFVDTLDLDLRTDMLAHPDQARAWLADAGLRAPEQPDLDADLRLARDVRESVRAMIAQNTGGGPLT